MPAANSISRPVKKCISSYETAESSSRAESGAHKTENLDLGKDSPSYTPSLSLAPQDLSVPWYLRSDIKSSLLEERKIELPLVPPHAPEHVSEFLRLLATDYGMDDILLFDLSVLDESHEFRSNNSNVDFVIISTGKSERHILKASTEFRTHIKHKYLVLPSTEGMVSTAKTPAMRRKLLRRARKGPSSTDNEYGRAANSWVLFHHERVDIHIMTSERRTDLNLESLWCRPEDAHLYEQKQTSPVESDHIFSGKRFFHTLVPRRNYSFTERSRHQLNDLLSQPKDLDSFALGNLKSQFDANFEGDCVEDYRVKYEFYRTMHLQNPALVGFEDAEEALLEKYASLEVSLYDVATEKIDDVVKYCRLLLDSPATRASTLEDSDTALDKLSKFISSLYLFSSEEFSMSANPDFIPLLWSLTFFEQLEKAASSFSESSIKTGEVTNARTEQPSLTMASNNARNVLTLIDHYNRVTESDIKMAPEFREFVLFTYGRSGKWGLFWEEWNGLFFPLSPSPLDAWNSWVHLVKFLLRISNRSQNAHFFKTYWRGGTNVSGSLLECFESNGREFRTEVEKKSFIKAITMMADSLDPSKDMSKQILKELFEGRQHLIDSTVLRSQTPV